MSGNTTGSLQTGQILATFPSDPIPAGISSSAMSALITEPIAAGS
jgi:hypothetical protein